MSTYAILIMLSGLVIFSYLFDLVASRTRFPSVLLLLLLGIGLRLLVDHWNIHTVNFLKILPALGTVGLILIVFEGSLELRYEREKNRVIKGAFFSALIILLLTVSILTFILQQLTGQDLYRCFINAIPFSVISSAIAIPSVASFGKKTKEFVIYESSFSDILGIILFNFALSNSHISFTSFASLTLNTAFILIISTVACVVLLYLMGRIKHSVKFFLIISILILIYAIGQSYHLSSLILILAFGLFLNNADTIKNPAFKSLFIYKNLEKDLSQLHQLSAESAFILRTFFFVIFGFTIQIEQLNDPRVLVHGCFILISIYLVRFLYLRLFKKEHFLPEAFITPRGLISILLYYNLPESLKIPEIGTAYLFLVVLGTSTVMSVGLLSFRKKTTEISPPSSDER